MNGDPILGLDTRDYKPVYLQRRPSIPTETAFVVWDQAEHGSIFFSTGPLFVGAIVVWALMGSLTIQLCLPISVLPDDYHNTSRGPDRVAIKVIVYFVFLVEFLQTIMITHTCWFMLIANWGNPSFLVNTPWSSAAISVLNGIVQCFFSWRIWQLTYSIIGRVVAVMIGLISFLQLGAAAAMTAEYVIIARDTSKLRQLSVVADTWLVTSLVGDTIIAVSMVIVLNRAKSQSSFSRTETLLNRLIIATIETGVVTAGFALPTLVLFKVFPNSYYFLTTRILTISQYATVLFTALNGRNRSRNKNSVMSNFGTVNLDNFGTEMNAVNSARNMGTARMAENSMGVIISTTVNTAKSDVMYTKGEITF
ncbi:hypothetical protein DFH09DRAFT_1282513 [Mycena vulgaris]|nr:hypothetical protein DFH09DRAFT_1282513 [Mycena vulgaris]